MKMPTKQTVKDFFSIQKTFFTEAFFDYFRPLKYVVQLAKTVVLFFSIVFEMPVQMIRCFSTKANVFDAEQDEKFRSEVREGLEKEKEVK